MANSEIDQEELDKIANNSYIHVDIKKPRNPQFHRKFFAMLNVGFSLWNPTFDNDLAEKDYDEFRKYCLIKAGFRYVVGYPDGEVRVRAKSMSFANMDETEFSMVYNKVLDVLLHDVLKGISKEKLEQAIDDLLQFT